MIVLCKLINHQVEKIVPLNSRDFTNTSLEVLRAENYSVNKRINGELNRKEI